MTQRMARRRPLFWLSLLLVATSVRAKHGSNPSSANTPEADGWTSEVLIRDFEHLWDIAWLPDRPSCQRPRTVSVLKSYGLDFLFL
jgi:glucose/arabinose dehydrogenase